MMQSGVKISVILPVYNVEKYLARCLNSVVLQSYNNLEIICINDGSKDNSIEILKNYAAHDGRIKIFNQTNRGLSATRNVGIGLATGDYIHFVDTDDYISLGLYEKFAHTVASEQRMIDIFLFNGLTHLEDRTLPEDIFFTLYKMDDWGDLSKSHFKNLYMHTNPAINTWGVWNKIYRREFLLDHNCRFLEGCIFEDKLFNAETLLETDNIYIFDDLLYCYKGHGNSITQTLGENVFDLLRIADGILRTYLYHGFFHHAKYSYCQYLMREILYGAIRCRSDLLDKFMEESRKRLMYVVRQLDMNKFRQLPFFDSYKDIMGMSVANLRKKYKK